ncbi:unnamed protein product [Strongylus vulgaris]|uniref:Uncharacterized protein n=1 Tax=Strongylus vulgaris TaxID=40348 RepID=A0A3P7IGN7_STRVU|nr:unnamed protein product [Strongylus vulgaris]
MPVGMKEQAVQHITIGLETKITNVVFTGNIVESVTTAMTEQKKETTNAAPEIYSFNEVYTTDTGLINGARKVTVEEMPPEQNVTCGKPSSFFEIFENESESITAEQMMSSEKKQAMSSKKEQAVQYFTTQTPTFVRSDNYGKDFIEMEQSGATHRMIITKKSPRNDVTISAKLDSSVGAISAGIDYDDATRAVSNGNGRTVRSVTQQIPTLEENYFGTTVPGSGNMDATQTGNSAGERAKENIAIITKTRNSTGKASSKESIIELSRTNAIHTLEEEYFTILLKMVSSDGKVAPKAEYAYDEENTDATPKENSSGKQTQTKNYVTIYEEPEIVTPGGGYVTKSDSTDLAEEKAEKNVTVLVETGSSLGNITTGTGHINSMYLADIINEPNESTKYQLPTTVEMAKSPLIQKDENMVGNNKYQTISYGEILYSENKFTTTAYDTDMLSYRFSSSFANLSALQTQRNTYINGTTWGKVILDTEMKQNDTSHTSSEDSMTHSTNPSSLQNIAKLEQDNVTEEDIVSYNYWIEKEKVNTVHKGEDSMRALATKESLVASKLKEGEASELNVSNSTYYSARDTTSKAGIDAHFSKQYTTSKESVDMTDEGKKTTEEINLEFPTFTEETVPGRISSTIFYTPSIGKPVQESSTSSTLTAHIKCSRNCSAVHHASTWALTKPASFSATLEQNGTKYSTDSKMVKASFHPTTTQHQSADVTTSLQPCSANNSSVTASVKRTSTSAPTSALKYTETTIKVHSHDIYCASKLEVP